MRASVLVALLAAAGGAGGCDGKRARRLGRGGDAGPAVVLVDPGAEDSLPTAEEREPNDGVDAAQRLSPPGAVRGTIGKAGDEDRYRVEVAQAGVLRLRLTGGEGADLVLDVLDGAGTKVLTSDNGPSGAVEGAPNVGVQPGAYVLVVREFVKKPRAKKGQAPPPERAGPSGPYRLVAELGPTPAAGDEVEPNDQAAFAAELPLGGTATGYVGWRRDRDVWRVPLSAAGEDEALSVDVDAVPEVALRVSVLDGTEAVLLERLGRVGEPLAVRNVAVRPGEPHYFVVVSGTRGHLEERYTVRVSSAPFQLDEEAEPNDAPASAGPLADVPSVQNGTRVGFLGRGDVDLYKLDPAPGARRLHLTLEPPAAVDGVLAVVDERGAALVEPADAGKRGAPEHLEGVAVAAERTVYVKVSARSGSSDTERYRLRWSVVADEGTPPVPGVDGE